jgi:hypothetical protein
MSVVNIENGEFEMGPAGPERASVCEEGLAEIPTGGVSSAPTAESPDVSVAQTGTVLNVSHPEGELTLQGLFDGVHAPIEDPVHTCKAVEPFITLALENEPDSRVLREAAAFIKSGITSGPSSGWSCTVSQLHSIIHLLNGNEILVQTGPIATDEDEREFLAQLEDIKI